ncbi:MAG: coth protein-domain-containing protein [Linnemannia gamsii]|nr:MAG: coth protein-domain-containing protein [Linnemannia gamsii]
MVHLLLGLTACAAMAMADVTFNVVGLREDAGDSFGVMVNGKLTKLTTNTDIYPLWSANVAGVNAPLTYKYVQLEKNGKIGKQEEAERKLPEGAVHTPNEFFDRSHTLHDLPPLPQVYDNKLEQNSPFFREGYIGNIFVEGDPAKIKYLNKGGADFHPNPIKVKVQYIGANENIKISNVTFNLSGASAREYAKLAYKLKFPKKNRLLDLATLKLRSGETDATMMREKLYIDILNSLGVPTQQSAYVRLFLNNQPIGLYVAMEEMKKHWIKKVLHPDVKKTKAGPLWKMNSCCGHEGNLEWLGPTTKSYVLGDIYKNILPGKNPKDDLMADLIVFMKDLKDYDPKKVKDPIAYWEQRLDLDGFLKSMAMEHLAGAWDAYWKSGSNYQIYKDPLTNKWIWLPIDFDDTFGTSYDGKIDSYRAVPKKNALGFESPLAQRLIIETPQINARFEQILKDTVNTAFKPEAMAPRIEGYKKMIQEDVAWDRVQPRVSKGKSEKFTIEDLHKGLRDGTKDNWGLMNWIEKRTTEVEKSLKFKVQTGTDSKVAIHKMTTLNNPFGVVVAKQATSISQAAVPVAGGDTPMDAASDPRKNGASSSSPSAATQQKDKKSSAESLKSQWSVLGAVAVAFFFAL